MITVVDFTTATATEPIMTSTVAKVSRFAHAISTDYDIG